MAQALRPDGWAYLTGKISTISLERYCRLYEISMQVDYPFTIPVSSLLAKKYPLYPTLGIAGTAIGTAVALLLIPENPYPAGNLMPSATAMTIGLLLAPTLASLRNPQTALRAEHLLVLAPVYWLLLDLLQGAYALVQVDKEAIESAFIAIGLFVIGIWIAALSRPRKLPKLLSKAATHPLNPKTIFRLILIFFALGIFRFAYPSGFNPLVMIYYLGQNRWNAPWTRGQLGGWDAFLDHMAYFGYLLPTLTILLALRSRWLDHRVIVSIGLSLIMAAFYAQGGNRRIIGVIFGASIICWILEQHHLKIRHLIVLAFSIFLLLFSMQYMLEYRNTGFKKLFKNQHKELQYEHLHVDDNFLRLSQIIDIVPASHSYVYHQQIIFVLVRPIPRVLWSSKPVDPGFDLTKAVGLKGVSLSSSVIGEWYLSAGWLGVLFGGWIYGRLASIASLLLIRYSESAAPLVYSLSAMALFAGMRSMLDLVLMSYALLAWMFITWIILPINKKENNH